MSTRTTAAATAVESAGLPAAFVERLRLILEPEQVDQALSAFAGDRATAFRANTLKVAGPGLVEELERDGLSPTPLQWKADAFTIPPAQRRALTAAAACRDGRLYIQNPSSMLIPLILDPQPGEEVLDLCAAPGGKTSQMAAMMANRGRIAAVESVRSRFFRLRANLERAGVEIADTYLRDGSSVWRQCRERFDAVLLDAPCTSEGRFRLDEPDSYALWRPGKVRELQRKQRRLLFSAVQSLRPGGRLVYSTCTFAPEENELVVDGILRRFGAALEIEAIAAPVAGVSSGLTGWRRKLLDPSLERALRILPDELMEGFFVCRLFKRASTPD